MSNRIIKVNRGDSFEFNVKVTDKNNNEKYTLTAYDAVYFALLYPNQRFEDALVLQGYTIGDQNDATGEVIIKITPDITRSLTPGIYYYTVKLQRGGTLEAIDDFDNPDEVRTLIERTKFIINE